MPTLIVATLLTTASLWVGMKLTHVNGTIYRLLVIAAVASGLSLGVPSISPPLWGVGALLAAIATLVLIVKLTDAKLWPDAVLMSLVAMLVGVIGTAILTMVFLI